MANEKRLIDVNALIQKFSAGETMKTMTQNVYDAMFVKALQEAPTVDAVEVVRCCDCVSCKVILDNVGAGHWHCKKRYGLPEVDPTDFCSSGERRTDNERKSD